MVSVRDRDWIGVQRSCNDFGTQRPKRRRSSEDAAEDKSHYRVVCGKLVKSVRNCKNELAFVFGVCLEVNKMSENSG